MKLKKLTIKNIASIEDAVIDFSEYPLANQDLFLICGPTGSGKSTLLDAICIALFDTTPRIENSQKGHIDEFDDTLVITKVKDVLNLVRKNAVEATITLTFDDKDGFERMAEWRVCRSGQYRGGKEVSTFTSASLEEKLSCKLKKEWTLTDTKGGVITKDVASEIQEAIGMTFDQFCKTTMLAQGEFTKFLSSNPESKAEILEKMVGTEIYGQVGQKINERSNSLARKVELLQNELYTIGKNALPAERKLACLNRLSEIEKQVQDLTGQIDKVNMKLKWMENNRKIVADIQNAQKEKAAAELNAQSEQVKQDQNTVSLWDRTTDVRNDIKLKQELDGQIKNLSAKIVLLKDDYLKAEAGLLNLKTQTEKLGEEIRTLAEKQSGMKPFEEMFAQSNVIMQLHADVVKNDRFIAENKPKIADFGKKIEQLKKKLSQNNEKLSTANGTIADNDKQLKLLDSKLSALDADKIDQEVKHLNDKKLLVSETKNALETWKTLHDDCTEKDKLLKKIKDDLDQKSKDKDTKNSEVEQARKAFDASELIYNQTKESVGDYAKTLRAELKVGDFCPVCGNKVTQVLADEYFEQILKPIREKLEQDKKNLDDRTVEYSKLISEISVGTRNIQQVNCDLSHLQGREQNALLSLQKKCEILNVQHDAQLPAALEKLAKENESVGANIAERQQKIAEIRQKKEEIVQKTTEIRQKLIGPITEENEKTQVEISRLQQNLSQLQGEISSKNMSIIESKKKIEELTNPDWKPVQEDHYYDELQCAAKQYVIGNQMLENKKNQQSQWNREIEQSEGCRKAVLKKFPEWRELTDVAVPVQELSGLWIDLQTETKQVSESLTEKVGQRDEYVTKIKQFFGEHPIITMDAVKNLLSLTPDDIETKRKCLDDLRIAVETAKARLDAATKRQQELPANPLSEDETDEVLQEQMRNLNQQKNNVLIEKGNIDQALQTDQEGQRMYSAKEAEKNLVEAEANEWKMLDDYLGSTGGKKFRNIAQSFILGELLDKANVYLENITGRYTLFCNPGTLTILMRDAFQGGVVRPTNTLSGGESFIISLSLALGLSSMQSSGLEVDTLFIDEGFGTLSPEYLDPVITALKRLYEQYGRRVGIISHVDTLKARIPVTIEVSQQGNSSSKVEVVAI